MTASTARFWRCTSEDSTGARPGFRGMFIAKRRSKKTGAMVLHREEMEVKHTLWAIRAGHFAHLRPGLLTRSFREALAVDRNEKVRAAAAELER